MSTKSIALEEQRARLERRANVIRSRLLRTIDELDDRRHQVQELGHHAKRLAIPAAFSVVGVALVAAGTAFAVRALVERRRSKDFGYRLAKALAPFREARRPPLWKDALRKVTLAMLGVVATELAKRGAHALLANQAPALDAGSPAPALPAANGSSSLTKLGT